MFEAYKTVALSGTGTLKRLHLVWCVGRLLCATRALFG